MATQATAKKIYSAKVCRGYLNIPEGGCNAAFDRLIENMRSGYEALAPTAPEAPALTTAKK